MGIRLLRISFTFVLITIAWVFFRQPTIGDAFGVFERMLTDHGALFKSPIKDIVFSSFAILTVVSVDVLKEFRPAVIKSFEMKSPVFRWVVYYFVILVILLCGVFDSSQFIYVSF